MHAAAPALAVVLARGLGTRMRAADAAAPALTPAQAAMADAGIKAMVDVGRPFLDHVLSGLADAGFAEACLVIGPEHDVVRRRYGPGGAGAPTRLAVRFAEQARPIGTADAVLAAEPVAGEAPFVVLNGDNLYPSDALARLRTADVPPDDWATLAFSREGLVRDGAIPAERIASFALLDVGPDGCVRRLVEKPDAATLAAWGPAPAVSMNCWRVTASVFRACREVAPSRRGELELPLAVQHAIARHGRRVHALPVDAPVLDLSRRGDVAVVAARLRGAAVRL